MPFIFGRETHEAHGALAGPAGQLANSTGEPLERAIGRNLLFDRRVSEARAEHFYEFTGKPSTSKDLIEALRIYVVDWIEVSPPENTYLSPANACNIIDVNSTFQLARVLNISRIIYLVSKSPRWTNEEKLRFADGEDLLTHPGANPSAVTQFVDELLEAENRLNGNRPTWGARWIQFKKHIQAAEPDSWNSAVGVFRDRNCLQMVVRYAANGLRLARPTQLDIGPYAYHFPSPPDLEKSFGGYAMSLHDYGSRKPPPLVSEYIHPPRLFTSRDWFRAGGWYGLHPGSREEDFDLNLYRQQHCDRMAKLEEARKNKRIRDWIARIKT